MKAHIFKNKDSMPALGLGTWKSAPGDVYKAVKIAIKTGYRHIDCAPVYGNEKEVGKAISECIAEGMVKRTDLWITSKLWNNQHARTDVVPALKQTLSDLNTTYLDLFLIHWPIALKKDIMFPQSGKDMILLKEIPLTETWKGRGIYRLLGHRGPGKVRHRGKVRGSRHRRSPRNGQEERHRGRDRRLLRVSSRASPLAHSGEDRRSDAGRHPFAPDPA